MPVDVEPHSDAGHDQVGAGTQGGRQDHVDLIVQFAVADPVGDDDQLDGSGKMAIGPVHKACRPNGASKGSWATASTRRCGGGVKRPGLICQIKLHGAAAQVRSGPYWPSRLTNMGIDNYEMDAEKLAVEVDEVAAT